MNAQRAELESQLGRHGWNIVLMEGDTFEWWADEIWRLESTWSPVGARAYVAFLVDPYSTTFTRSRKKGQYVWAVKASPVIPVGHLTEAGEFTLSLGQGWKERLPEFLEHLETLRNRESVRTS
jgi:hypothetical protein